MSVQPILFLLFTCRADLSCVDHALRKGTDGPKVGAVLPQRPRQSNRILKPKKKVLARLRKHGPCANGCAFEPDAEGKFGARPSAGSFVPD